MAERKKIDDAIQWMDENMCMLYGICTNDDKRRQIPQYILNILRKHKRSTEEGKNE